jgi:UDP-GlcNAc:undecaprenyl-phosphate/decaprenyl-phosphate GlcNAc-1-phosphate transferase
LPDMTTTYETIPISALVERYWLVGVVPFVVALVATPLFRAMAIRKKIVDRPDDWLKPHKKPTALLGGLAIFLGWGAGLVIGLIEGTDSSRLLQFLVAGAGITVLGLFDDLRVLRPKTKLAGNIIVGLWLIFGASLGDDVMRIVTNLMHIEYDTPAQKVLLAIYSVPLSLFVIVGACNATNLIDGIDGLCSGVLGIISVGFLILAAHLAIYNIDGSLADDDERIVLSLAMLGAAAGFLPYNLNPATIFMGDTGSMLLGLNAATLILLFAESSSFRWLIGALMVFGLPVGDMLLTLTRRWRNARPLMEGDRSHFYDQLRDRGFSVKQVVAISYLLATLFVVVGCSVIFIRTRFAILVYMLAIAAGALTVGKLKMVQLERPSGNGNPPANPGGHQA